MAAAASEQAMIEAARAWPDDVRAVARAAHAAAVAAGRQSEAIAEGYAAGVEALLRPLSPESRLLVAHAASVFPSTRIRIEQS